MQTSISVSRPAYLKKRMESGNYSLFHYLFTINDMKHIQTFEEKVMKEQNIM